MSSLDPVGTLEFREVLAAERRQLSLPADGGSACGVGLALSGGGIRSASFALGVVQALFKRGVFARLDYLSTVSGGGYLGTALTWLRKCYPAAPDFERQFGSASVGARTEELAPAGAVAGCWLDYIRQHGNYLKPGRISPLSLVGIVLRSLATSLAVYGAAAAVLLAVLAHYCVLPDGTAFAWSGRPPYAIERFIVALVVLLGLEIGLYGIATWLGSIRPWATAVGGVVATALALALLLVVGRATPADAWYVWAPVGVIVLHCLVLVIVAALAVIVPRTSPASVRLRSWHYGARTLAQTLAGAILATLAGLATLYSIPFAYQWLGKYLALTTASGTIGTGGAVAAIRFLVPQKRSLPGGVLNGLVIPVAAALAIYGVLLLAYWIDCTYLVRPAAIAGLAALSLLIGLFVNVNYLGLGRMYRDRLMEAFLPDPHTVAAGQWQPAYAADGSSITDFADIRPLHLINCNVVMVDADSDKFRGRGGDSFVMSPLFSGSSATQWIASEQLAGKRGFSLATAMAVSGAAVNPDAGSAGRGVTRERLVSFLMSLFNVRLGFWLRNPARTGLGRVLAFGPPNFWFPGVVQGLFGRRLKESASFIELSDGGHFDNTALYELIRRRVRFIVASQAGADPHTDLEDLANSIERVRVDFGVHIRFDIPGYGITDLRPAQPAEDPHARRGFALATIRYPGLPATAAAGSPPPAVLGYLVYVQAVAVKSMESRPDVESYRRRNPTFPNETTANQFFTEEQLEAYRELGLMIGDDALSSIAADRSAAVPAAPGMPSTDPLAPLRAALGLG